MILKTALLLLAAIAVRSETMETINQWNLLEFDLPYDNNLISMFRPENTVFTGLEIAQDRLFLAMPRLREGVPATLASIPRHTPPGSSPVLSVSIKKNFLFYNLVT